mmetsp:Transcript_13132/g.55007  ORF Transcript_13132/g.55007 Transcript_13132/m.55007 type:complete len:343 (+) Transcript_13132:888-1916(+)
MCRTRARERACAARACLLNGDKAEVVPGVGRGLAELLLDTQQLVVLGKALGAAGRAGLDLAGGEAHGEVSNESVLSLAGAVRGHDAPAGALGHLHGLDGLGDRTDLVDLQQQRVARLPLDGRGHAFWVGAQQVVADDLHAREVGGELGGVVEVVLIEGILDGNEGVLLAEVLVQLDHLRSRLLVRAVVVFGLEVEVVHLVLGVELGGGHVHADLHLARVARLLDGLDKQVESFLVGEDGRREATLVAHVDGVLAVLRLDHLLEVVVHLAAHAHGLSERRGAHRQHHELLHGQLVASVRAAVDHVERGHGQHELGVARQLGDVLVQRDAKLGRARLAHGHRHR